MADSNKSGAFSGPKEMWKNPKARKGMIIFGGVAVIVLGTTLTMLHKQDNKNASIAGNIRIDRPSVSPNGDQMSPQSDKYKAMVRELDERRLADAQKTPGSMVLPKIAGLSDPTAKPEPEAKMSADIVRTDQPANAQVNAAQSGQKVQTPQERARLSPSYAAAMKMMSETVTKATLGDEGWNVVRPIGTGQTVAPTAAAGVQVQGAQAAQGLLAQASQPAGPPLIQMGTAVFATLDTAINTDYSGPVIATLHEGKYSGAKLSGTKTLEFDAVVLKFSSMSPGPGLASIPVNAYAITIDDAKKFGLSGLQGETDRHILQRWVAPAAAAFITGYGQAAAQQRQTVVSTNSGYTQNTDSLSSRDRMITAAGIAVQPIVSDLQRMASRPITVSLPSNHEMGILFAADVVNNGKNPVVASVAPTATAEQGLTQQQMYLQAQQQVMQEQAARQQQQSQQNFGQTRTNYPYQPTNLTNTSNQMYGR